jgi:hypothetical protein
LVQAVHEIFLEHLEQQGQADFSAVQAGQAGAGLHEGEVGEAGLPEVEAGAANIAGGLAEGEEEAILPGGVCMGG